MIPAGLKFPSRGSNGRSILWWLFFVALGVLSLAVIQQRIQLAELELESNELHRLASQRAGQHDAHLTALSAVAVASAGQRPDLFLDVAATISRFYPRILDVQLVPLDPTAPVVGSMPLGPGVAAEIRAAAQRSTGLPVVLPHPSQAQHYLMVKRSPNSDDAIYALALRISAAQLLESERNFWSGENVGARLSLPNSALLFRSAGMTAVQYSKAIESASQPLLLETSILIGVGNMLPPFQVILVVLTISLAYVATLAIVRQRSRTRVAESEADLRRMEAQLTHASRVNAMGEMASGMAHELTQPLTAILAQAQAGRRLVARGDIGVLEPAFGDIAAQAKRASAILERLRNWSRPQRGPIGPIDLRDALNNVQVLLSQEAERRGVLLRFDSPRGEIAVSADQVEMEQVLHNIIRNAFEALEAQTDGEISVLTKTSTNGVVLEVADNGPGVDEALWPRLFTPFTTTRENGTGLGLALSQRLVERAGGEISYVGGTSGARFRIVLPTVTADKEQVG